MFFWLSAPSLFQAEHSCSPWPSRPTTTSVANTVSAPPYGLFRLGSRHPSSTQLSGVAALAGSQLPACWRWHAQAQSTSSCKQPPCAGRSGDTLEHPTLLVFPSTPSSSRQLRLPVRHRR